MKCETCQKKIKLNTIFRPKFVKIKAGTFLMGSPKNEEGRYDAETEHEVQLTMGFEMQATQITQAQWASIMKNNPSSIIGDNLPVTNVSWFDVKEYIKKLNLSQKKYVYRLPTEAEWEYAARAGTVGPRYFYLSNLDDNAWHHGNANNCPHAVATKQPNPWGLYDMIGNIWEWCEDWYGAYPTNMVENPKGPDKGSNRVIRGGSFSFDVAGVLRADFRGFDDPGISYVDVGFRPVREIR